MVKLTIDGVSVEVSKGAMLIDAAKQAGVTIPTLCYLELHADKSGDNSSCRICVVEVAGRKNLAPACSTPVMDGMEVKTATDRVVNARKVNIELLLSDHAQDCLICGKAGKCGLQDLCYQYDIKETPYRGLMNSFPLDESNEFYVRDNNKCVHCRRCVNACTAKQCTDAIDFANRGFTSHPATPFEDPVSESTCVSCGNCVSVCPTAALMPKSKEKFRTWEVSRTTTTCSYCGVGCQMDLLVKGGKVVGVEPVDGLANNGLLCVKGKFGYNFVNHPDRLKTPLIKKDGAFVEATWEEALTLIADKVKSVKEAYGPEALAGLASARVTNEENYLFQKMVRTVFGTNQVDHCARLCHASTVAGLATTLGSGAMTNSIVETVDSDVIFVTGSNTTETHPVIGAMIRQAKQKGAKIIVAEPRRIDLVKDAEVFLQITPGTNVALFNGMMNVILAEGLQNREFIAERTENFDELVEVVSKYSPEKVAEICGINAEDLKKAARMYATADKASIFYSMGVTQHSTGVSGVMGTSNLALLCGHLGKESSGVNPLRGQNNVQGSCDMGCLPGDLPGYQKTANPEVIAKFEKAWGVPLSDKPGLTVTEIVGKAGKGEIKVLYIMGENPMLSDPDLNHVQEALENTEFLVVQDIFLTETAELADVVLPAASFAEKDGTFTNTERRVQLVRKAIEAPGKAKADWEILVEVMNRLGYAKTYRNVAEIMDEIATVTPQYGGISFARLESGGLQWPCPTADHPGTKFLHKGTFARGKGLFKPAEYIPSAELPDTDYPFILTTGRILYHYHTKTMTGKVDGLNNLFPGSFIEIHPAAAAKLGIKDGEKVKVTSRRGDILSTAKLTAKVEENVLFMPFHFADGAANRLTNKALDPVAKIPEFKVSAATVEPFDRVSDYA
ncbi:MAG: formate dehydrogenase subunit alpha [Deltaproteobacteria bacterium]|nr:formate dehydrogenase subunit alpha [Deltaproteobacteria bacterium]TLN04639.1 MAG: formate dehydrogenase subunit alpha [bacterium]